jgi:alpha-glucosidase
LIYKLIYGNPDVDSEAVIKEKRVKILPKSEKYKIENIFEDISLKKEGEFLVLEKKIEEGMIFGFGDKVGQFNRRGKQYIFWNTDNFTHHPGSEPLYKSFPFFIFVNENKKYGIFTDYPGYMEIDLDSEGRNIITFKIRGEGFTQYVILEEKIDKLLKSYLYLTGKNVAFPFWSLGYQQSRWSYFSKEEVLNLAKTFREKQIPCDVIWLDIDYMDSFKLFTWNKEKFSDHKEMLEELHKMGFKVSAILDPGVKVEEGYRVFEEAKDRYFLKDNMGKDFEGAVWPGRVRFPDFTSKNVRKWWSQKVREFVKDGIDGIWNDMNEIAIFGTDEDIAHAKEKLENLKLEDGIGVAGAFGEIGSIPRKDRGNEIVHLNGKKHYKLRNVYGFNMIRATQEGFPKNYRNINITRAAYSGVQRFGGVWTGDNHSWWEHILLEIQRIMSLSLVGVFNTGFDVGGFGGNTSAELMVRFMQLGSFMPLFRNHSAIGTRRQEPWTFDKKYEKILKKIIEYRYRLIPYLYSEYMIGILKDIPLIAPLFLHFEKDKKTYQIDDQFMVGRSIIVAPIYKPGAKSRLVYLPKRSYDLNNNKFLNKGWHEVNATLEEIPHFALDGSIILTQESKQYLENSYEEEIIGKIFAYSGKAIGYFYEDDGKTNNYKKGMYNLYKFIYKHGELKIKKIREGYKHKKRNFSFEIFTKTSIEKINKEF